MTHEDYLNKAISIAQKSMDANQGGPFGCVIVKDGKIIAEGFNRVTSTNDPTAHAEVVAIRQACEKLNSFQLKDCIIYTSCEPCPMCLGAMYWARPKAVYFASTRQDAAAIGFDDQFIYDELNQRLEKRKIPFFKMNVKSASELFHAWHHKEDKAEY